MAIIIPATVMVAPAVCNMMMRAKHEREKEEQNSK